MNEDNSYQNASTIEIEDVGEDLQADNFINLNEHGHPGQMMKNQTKQRYRQTGNLHTSISSISNI